jgi:hypothetical protein
MGGSKLILQPQHVMKKVNPNLPYIENVFDVACILNLKCNSYPSSQPSALAVRRRSVEGLPWATELTAEDVQELVHELMDVKGEA